MPLLSLPATHCVCVTAHPHGRVQEEDTFLAIYETGSFSTLSETTLSINLPSAWCSYGVSSAVFEGKQLLILIPRLPLTGFCQITGPLKSSGWLVPGLVEWLADWQALKERTDYTSPLR